MIAREQEAERVLKLAQCLHDAASVSQACRQLAQQIAARTRGRNPLILPLMTGGMFAAVEILKYLDFPLELDYLHATRYRNQIQGSELIWKVLPSADLRGRVVVVIDDILDEGHTLQAVRQALLAQQPGELLIAALVDKQTPKRVAGVEADLIGLQVPDRYVFGCGMDYKGFWRQLPAIYAVAGSGA